MAESDIEVGSRVRYVGFKRNVRDGAEGVVTKFLPPDRFWVSFGGFTITMGYARCELELVLPPKPSTEAPTLNSYDMVQDPDGTIWTVVRDSDEEVVELHNPSADRCHYALLRVVENWTRVGRFDASTEARFKRSHRCELASGAPTPSPAKTEPYNSELVGVVRAHYERIVHSRLEERLRTGDAVAAMASKIYSTMLRAASPVNTVWAGSWTGDAEPDGAIAMIVPTVPPDLPELKYGPAVNTVSTGIAALNLQAPPRPRRRHQTTSWDPGMPLPDSEPGRYGWLP